MSILGCFFDHCSRASGLAALSFLSREGAKARRGKSQYQFLRAFAPSRDINIGSENKFNTRFHGKVGWELAL